MYRLVIHWEFPTASFITDSHMPTDSTSEILQTFSTNLLGPKLLISFINRRTDILLQNALPVELNQFSTTDQALDLQKQGDSQAEFVFVLRSISSPFGGTKDDNLLYASLNLIIKIEKEAVKVTNSSHTLYFQEDCKDFIINKFSPKRIATKGPTDIIEKTLNSPFEKPKKTLKIQPKKGRLPVRRRLVFDKKEGEIPPCTQRTLPSKPDERMPIKAPEHATKSTLRKPITPEQEISSKPALLRWLFAASLAISAVTLAGIYQCKIFLASSATINYITAALLVSAFIVALSERLIHSKKPEAIVSTYTPTVPPIKSQLSTPSCSKSSKPTPDPALIEKIDLEGHKPDNFIPCTQ